MKDFFLSAVFTFSFCPSSVLTLKRTHSSPLWFSPCHTHILSFFTYHLASHTFCLSSHLQCTHFAILEISPCNTHTLLFFSSPLAIHTLCLSGVLTLQYTHFASVLILQYTYLFYPPPTLQCTCCALLQFSSCNAQIIPLCVLTL